MPKAIWKNTVIVESVHTIMVEGNHYFPPDAIKAEFFRNSGASSRCIWKGKASYYHIQIGDARNKNAAWYYPKPWILASNIKDYVAFWRGVEIIEL